jgi:hypothetical protein
MAKNERTRVRLTVPKDVTFSDLRLERAPNGDIAFDISVLMTIWSANGFHTDTFYEAWIDNATEIIVEWYRIHCQRGGEIDPVMEQLLSETRNEIIREKAQGHKPGRA